MQSGEGFDIVSEDPYLCMYMHEVHKQWEGQIRESWTTQSMETYNESDYNNLLIVHPFCRDDI